MDGPWLRDAKGRVVLLRGANYVRGELLGLDGHAPREEDFAFLASLGFNLVRLPVAWGSVEPRPNEYDFAFLRDQVDPLLRFANNHGMQVVLAMERARSSSCLLGPDRVPSWTCAEAGAARSAPGWGPPEALAEARANRAQCGFFRDAQAPDGRLLRTHYAEAWRMLARYYDQDRRIVGFDLLDQPSPGTCFSPESFVGEVLKALYVELARVIRDSGAPQALVYQPAASRHHPLLGMPEIALDDAIFAPHLFGQAFGAPAAPAQPLGALYDRARDLAGPLGGLLLVGEIGANAPAERGYRPATQDFLQASLDELDRRLIGGAVWAFVPQGEKLPASGGIGIGNDADAALLARPFARRIAGVPLEMRFDAVTRAFSFRFRDDPEDSPPDPTEIFLPARRRYPDGFVVEVTPGDRWTFDEHNQRLLLYRGAASTHEVRISPAAGSIPGDGSGAR